jgi:HEAT repeat protein
MGPEGKTAIPDLLKSLTDESAFVRSYGASALGKMEPTDARVAIPALTEALKDEDRSVRVSAALALWWLDRQGKLAVSVLLDVLQDTKNVPGVRRDAVWALELIGPEAKAAVPSLMDAIKDDPDNIGRAAKEALKRIDPQGAANAKE